MHPQKTPSLLIRLIALKKGIYALVLLLIAAISAFSWRNYDWVTAWMQQYLLEAEYDLVRWGLEKLSAISLPTLKLIARIAGIYGTLLGVAAIGLWQGKAWADPLFIGLVGLLIPVEIYEVIHAFSVPKVILFCLNVIVFGVLLAHWLKSREGSTPDASESAS